jgi:CDGSH-type Zn-finger protein
MEEQSKDNDTAAIITITGRGPIRIEGKFELVDSSGLKVFVDNNIIKICGCGRSETMPICDGTHKK